ncbi:LETM1 and EF-hand domain-containing protein 1, mitochondrial [Platysternon megacephalum]|uniref:LETM1 and EF-hand domain-containing protein 1, mitochondrial n=1 Tax=Platysternon megacephalum TaxID=55544 RepID=A0A4D9EJZ7_9SAUR|nr:LETM1 and EF-hand domain-containing protein 1, mitochondrial [Platysternon megacephalum]
MFHKATKDLAKQLAPDGDLLPVSSLIDQDRFRPLYLVRRKPKRFWMIHHRYYKTGFRLSDILVPGQDSRNLDVQDSHSITVEDCTDGRVEWTIKLPEDFVSTEVTVAASTSQVKSIKVKRAEVSPADLVFLQERKINMDHSFIKDLRKRRENLYVVNEAVQALEETKLQKVNTMEGTILNEIYVRFSLKGTRGSKRVIVIPTDCVLAFRIKPLIIQSESWGISHHPDEETFAADGVTVDSGYSPDGGMGDLEREVEKECAELSQLSTDLRAKFLKSIIAVIINSDLLQELTLKLEEAFEDADKCELKSENPDLEDLLNNLQDSEGSINLDLVGPVLYTLQALGELTEDQLLRLAQSVEKQIVSKQLALVKSILKQDFHLKDAFSLDAKLVSSLQEEELNITKAMIGLGGVTLQRNGPSFTGTGDLAAFSALSALYVALYALHLLSRSD